MMNRWDEYLALTAELDDVRLEADDVVAAQRATADNAAIELSGIRQRIALQRSRLSEVAGGIARAQPPLEPLPDEHSAAVAAIRTVDDGQPEPHIGASLRHARAALDMADATLTAATTPAAQRGPLSGRPPGVRAMIVYGWFALLSLVSLVEINSIVGTSFHAAVELGVFAVVVPAGAWLLGWLSLYLLFGQPTADGHGSAGSTVAGQSATPRRPSGALLGAMLCAVPLVVGSILAAV